MALTRLVRTCLVVKESDPILVELVAPAGCAVPTDLPAGSFQNPRGSRCKFHSRRQFQKRISGDVSGTEQGRGHPPQGVMGTRLIIILHPLRTNFSHLIERLEAIRIECSAPLQSSHMG